MIQFCVISPGGEDCLWFLFCCLILIPMWSTNWYNAQFWCNENDRRILLSRRNNWWGIWSQHFMANRQGNNGNSDRLYFWRAQKSLQMVTEAMIKRCWILGRKVMTNLDNILKIRDITLPTKVHLVKAMVFLVVMYGCESWTIKKAKRRRIDVFELWCWRRLLRVPWTPGRSN